MVVVVRGCWLLLGWAWRVGAAAAAVLRSVSVVLVLSSPALAAVLLRFLLFRLGFSSGYMQLHFNGFAKFHN
jgi:hypothetical protein